MKIMTTYSDVAWWVILNLPDLFYIVLLGRGCQNTVGCELEIQVLLLQNSVHKSDYLKNQLILSKVISMFEQRYKLTAIAGLEGQPEVKKYYKVLPKYFVC